MTTLITGGTGKTGSPLVQRLHRAGLPVLFTTRSGTPFGSVAFDWDDPNTFAAPFNADPTIHRVYIVIQMYTSADNVKAFIDLARTKGVTRFVLLSASQASAGDGTNLGEVHQYLIDSGVDYAVVRPTWFQQNFGTNMLSGIRDHSQTFSATANGRIAFVSTEDIAEVAFKGLTAQPSLNTDTLVFGPELLTHDEVAEAFSKSLGRTITHNKLTKEQFRDLFVSLGAPQVVAETLAFMEQAVAEDQIEEKLFNSTGNKFVGTHTLEEYIHNNRDLWIKK